MKRSDKNRKINRNNNTIFSHHATPTNFIPSDIFNEIWVQNDHTNSGVQIVELRSSDSGKSIDSLDDDKDYFPIPHQFPTSNQWCYTKQNIEEDYKRNEAARERRRQNNRNGRSNEIASDTSDCEDGYVFAELFVSKASELQPESVVYNQMNYFTILDKHLTNTDTSEEEFADVEVIHCNENNSNWANGGYNYDDDVMRCDEDAQDKRTVWIYSFKNKHLLSENDYELINIPSHDLSTNSSGEDTQPSIENNLNRISSPIPPYIPRLHLPSTPVLPTLTEVTEPGRQSSGNQTDEEKPIKKWGFRENNWFMSEPSTSKVEREDKSTSIVNWMALSPREKRRKLRNASPISLLSDLSGRLATVNEDSILEKKEELKADILVDLMTKGTDEACQCEGDRGDCARHVVNESRDENENKNHDLNETCDRSTLTEEKFQYSYRSCHQTANSGAKMETSVLDSSGKSVRTIESNSASNRGPLKSEKGQPSADTNIPAEVHTPKDRGDHLPRKAIPRIRVNSRTESKSVAGPMENFESNNWIYEEKLIKDDRIKTPKDAKGDRASDSLWVRNMVLLKPSEWAEYERVFDQESIPSLHLSLNSTSIEENQTLFKRLSKYLSCCKLFCK